MTTEQAEQTELRPFHETIVEAIRHMPCEGLWTLARLIAATKITQGHDEIIKAWNARARKEKRECLRYPLYQRSSYYWVFKDPDENFDVLASLLIQKRAAEAKVDGKKKRALTSTNSSEKRRSCSRFSKSVQTRFASSR